MVFEPGPHVETVVTPDVGALQQTGGSVVSKLNFGETGHNFSQLTRVVVTVGHSLSIPRAEDRFNLYMKSISQF